MHLCSEVMFKIFNNQNHLDQLESRHEVELCLGVILGALPSLIRQGHAGKGLL